MANAPSKDQPKRILSLDGGGVRGAFTIAYLERMERLLAEQAGTSPAPKLCDYFDLIGGTSTGAIIATALTLGYSASEIKELYFRLGPRVFRKSLFRLWLFQSRFDAEALRAELAAVAGDRRLGSEDLKTSLAIVTKRMDTGGPWILTNNPNSKYWEDPEDGSYIGNKHYRLADLVRASTAAPYYFAPHEIEITDGEPPGLFVDGGVSPFNNPALALFQVATIPAYGYGWRTGVDHLFITSIGTGMWRPRVSARKARRMFAVGLAIEALKSMSADSENQVVMLMQALGHTDMPWHINQEVGDLADVLLPAEPLFHFRRYDLRLEEAWFEKELGLSTEEDGIDVEAFRMLDNSDAIPKMYEVGQKAAERSVRPEHFTKTPST